MTSAPYLAGNAESVVLGKIVIPDRDGYLSLFVGELNARNPRARMLRRDECEVNIF
jgi:hypothetical protein